jgi:hypothetical protein
MPRRTGSWEDIEKSRSSVEERREVATHLGLTEVYEATDAMGGLVLFEATHKEKAYW